MVIVQQPQGRGWFYQHKLNHRKLFSGSICERDRKQSTGRLPHTVCVKLEFRFVDHSQCIKLIGQRTLPHHKLGGVGPIQTIHTVGPKHAGLEHRDWHTCFLLISGILKGPIIVVMLPTSLFIFLLQWKSLFFLLWHTYAGLYVLAQFWSRSNDGGFQGKCDFLDLEFYV